MGQRAACAPLRAVSRDALLLRCRDLALSRGEAVLFEGLDFSLHSGQLVQLRGVNGSGKTSLLRCMAGLLAPISGTCERFVSAGFLAADSLWPGDLRVAEAAEIWAGLGSPRHEKPDFEPWGLAGLETAWLNQLSTGQRQRLRLLSLEATRFPLWLLDEPLAGLDGTAQAQVAARLERHRAGGGSAILVTHQPLDLAFDLQRVLAIGSA